jgi:hypothetical protein
MSAGHAEADWADVQDGGLDDQQTWSAPPDVVDADDRESGPSTERVNHHLHASRSSQQLSEIDRRRRLDRPSRGRRLARTTIQEERELQGTQSYQVSLKPSIARKLLTTSERKMRKPDGISAEEALRGNVGRAQSVGPPKPLDEMQINDPDHQTKPVPSPSKTSRLLQDHKVGVRRKSILPKGGGRTVVMPTESDDTPGTPAVVSAAQEVVLGSGSITGGSEVAESGVDEAPKSTTSTGRRELPRDMAHHFPKTTSLSHTSQSSTTKPQERSKSISGSTKVKASSSSSCSADPSRAVPVVQLAESSAKPASVASRSAEAMSAAFRRTGLEPGLPTTATRVQTIRREPKKTVA